jgi:hypothetical protein
VTYRYAIRLDVAHGETALAGETVSLSFLAKMFRPFDLTSVRRGSLDLCRESFGVAV